MFVDPLALSFTKRGELASLKQLLFLAFIESDGAPPNFSIVADSVTYKSPETRTLCVMKNQNRELILAKLGKNN